MQLKDGERVEYGLVKIGDGQKTHAGYRIVRDSAPGKPWSMPRTVWVNSICQMTSGRGKNHHKCHFVGGPNDQATCEWCKEAA